MLEKEKGSKTSSTQKTTGKRSDLKAGDTARRANYQNVPPRCKTEKYKASYDARVCVPELNGPEN